MHTDDGHIVHQCLTGNTGAFALLVEKYKARLFALVYAKVGQFEDAEDITQDVFLNAYRKLSTLRRWDNFYAWLYSIASNRCKEFHRAGNRRVDTAFLADQSENYQADMDAHTEKLRNEQIHEVLASLPEIHRQVLVLRYMAGMRSKEIAQALRVSPNTINQRLMRARTQLKAVLNEEMITMIPTALAERKLQPGFTACIIDLVKGTQIQTAPHKTALPLGLSAAGGVIILLLSLSVPKSPLYPLGEWLGGPLPLKTQVLENGVIAIDAEATEVAILGGQHQDNSVRQKQKTIRIPSVIGKIAETDEKEKTITGIYLPNDASWDMDISHDGTKMVYLGRRVTPSGYEFQLIVSPLIDVSSDVPPRQSILVQGEGTTQYFQPIPRPVRNCAFQVFRCAPPIVGTAPCGCPSRIIGISHGTAQGLSPTDPQNNPQFLPRINAIFPEAEYKWSPNGKWIFYLSQRPSSRETHLGKPVWKQPVDGGKATPIDAVAIQHAFVYSPNGEWAARNNIVDTYSGFSFPGIVVDRLNEHGDLAGEPVVIEPAKLKETPKLLRWAPDGRIIVLQEDYIKVSYAALKTKNGALRYLGEATYSNVTTKSGALRYLSTDTSSNDPSFPLTSVQFIGVQWISDGKRLFFPFRAELPGYDPSSTGILDIETNHFTPIQLPVRTRIDESALSPDEKQIAFVRIAFLPDFNRLLYIMPVAGGTSKQLAHGKLFPVDLRWSPDGRTIAFINIKTRTSGSPKSQLCVVSVSDGQVKTLVDSGLCREPAWSPDGTMLAYTQYPYDDIHIVPATGGNSRQITSTPKQQESELTWTPDGRRLAHKVHGVEWWVISIDSGKPTKLHRNHIPSSWSSDGTSYLAFGPHGELQRISLDGAILSEFSVRAPTNAQPLSMSPDGETILIRHVDSEKSCWGIDVSHLDGL